MDATKRKALEAAGWKIGDAADFLEMSDEERQLLDARVGIALAIRRQREALKLSQKELGARLKTSQEVTTSSSDRSISVSGSATPSPLHGSLFHRVKRPGTRPGHGREEAIPVSRRV